jgi:hypothetical protein
MELKGQKQAAASLMPGKECPITRRIFWCAPELVWTIGEGQTFGSAESLTSDPRAHTVLTILRYFVMIISCMSVREYRIAI